MNKTSTLFPQDKFITGIIQNNKRKSVKPNGSIAFKPGRNWASFDPTHKPWSMDHPHGLFDK